MAIEVHIDWMAETHLVGTLFPAPRGTTVSFEHSSQWLRRPGSLSSDATSLPLHTGMHHSATLFGALQEASLVHWGRLWIAISAGEKNLSQKQYHEIDCVLALDDNSRIGALRFRANPDNPFLAASSDVIPPGVRIAALLRHADAIPRESETVQDPKLSPWRRFPSWARRGRWAGLSVQCAILTNIRFDTFRTI